MKSGLLSHKPPKHSQKKLTIDGGSDSPSLKTQNTNEARREKALGMIFTFFAKKGGLSLVKKATFEEMKI